MSRRVLVACLGVGLLGCGADQTVTPVDSTTKLVFVTQPSPVVAGQGIAPSVSVAVQNGAGQVVLTASDSIALYLTQGTGSTGAVLAGVVKALPINGVASFSGLTVNKPGEQFTLTAVADGMASAVSAAFDIRDSAAGVPTIVKVAGEGQTANAGTAVGVAPAVRILDALGAPVAGKTVTFAIVGGGGALAGVTQVTNAQGIATVGSWTLGALASINTISAFAQDVGSVTFTAVGVGGVAGKLVFSVQPGNGRPATAMSTTPRVSITDDLGNLVPANTIISLAITSGTGAHGAKLIGTVNRQATNGVVTFPELAIDLAGTNYTLTASAPSLTSATSSTFDVTAYSSLEMVQTTLSSDSAFAVKVTDGSGTPLPNVYVDLSSTAGSDTLATRLVLTNAQGIASMRWITAHPVGTVNTFCATIRGTSKSVTATKVSVPGPATQFLKWEGDYQSAGPGQATPIPPAVRALDAYGNPVPGVPIAFQVNQSDGSLINFSPTLVTDSQGIARATAWILGPLPGIYALYAGQRYIYSCCKPSTVAPFIASTGRISPDIQIGYGLPGPNQVVGDSLVISVQVVSKRALQLVTATVNGRSVTLPGNQPPRCSGCTDTWRATMYIGDMPKGTLLVTATATDDTGATSDYFRYIDHQ